MKISLHIGPDFWAASRVQDILADKRQQLLSKGVLFARSPGPKNHTRLFMAASNPEAVDLLRFNRGFITAEKQASLRDDVQGSLVREVETHAPEQLILSAHQLGTSLVAREELERLRAMLLPMSNDITIVAHVDCPARMLTRHYVE